MQGRFEINWYAHLQKRSKLIYWENRVGRKVLKYLELWLWLNSITSFTIINELLNYLEDIFGNFYWKKHAIKKFQGLKMRATLFIDFCSKFILLASDLEYTSEKVIWKFNHKVSSRLQDQLHSNIELSSTISLIEKSCLSIY